MITKQIDMNKAITQAGMIANMVGESPMVQTALKKMMEVLKDFDSGDTILSNGELMALAAAMVAQIVHTTIKTDPDGCPLSDEEMRVAVGFAALQLEHIKLH
jgi:hypothetical protein